MSKLTEKQLYETWLDISYAHELNEDCLHDWGMELKEMRKHRNKTKKLLKRAADAYHVMYGRYPQKKSVTRKE